VPGEVARIDAILESGEFQKAVQEAKRDLVSSVIEQVKRRLLKYVREMDRLAMANEDKRTKFQALKDLLDRGGTGASQKIALNTPSAYRDAVKDLLEDEETVEVKAQ
jgi:hypothetical protein